MSSINVHIQLTDEGKVSYDIVMPEKNADIRDIIRLRKMFNFLTGHFTEQLEEYYKREIEFEYTLKKEIEDICGKA